MRAKFTLGVTLFLVAFTAWMWEMERTNNRVKELADNLNGLSASVEGLYAKVLVVDSRVAVMSENLERIARCGILSVAPYAPRRYAVYGAVHTRREKRDEGPGAGSHPARVGGDGPAPGGNGGEAMR